MATAVGALDEAIKEYLVFRGFTNTLKHFELEKRDDKDKGFKVNRIVEHLMQCINRSDFQSLQSFWVYLHKRFFSRLSHDSLNTVYRLEINLLRLFLVYANRQGKHDVVRDFFDKMADSLHDKKEWKDWFAFPFTKSPESHPLFRTYYSKEWGDMFVITLHNFFSTLFTSLPLPALLNFETEAHKMQSLSTENHNLHQQLASAKQALVEAESNVQRLEARMATQLAQSTSQSARRTQTFTGSKIAKQTPGKSPMAPLREKTLTFAAPSPKKANKSNSLEDTTRQTEHYQKQKSDPTPQASGMSEVPSQQTEPPLSPTVVDEGCVKTFKGADGTIPYIAVSQEVYCEHNAPITNAKFSSNATRVATIDTDGFLKVWDPTSPTKTHSSIQLRSSLLSLDWAPQSDHLLLVGSGDGFVRLYDSVKSRNHWEIQSDNKYPKILSLVCSASSNTFAFSAAAVGGVSINSLATMGLTSPGLPSSRQSLGEMQQFRKSARAASVGEAMLPTAGGVFIWDLKTQKQKCSLPISPVPVGINCMGFNHNSNLLVTGGADGMIRLFDVSQGESLFGWNAHDGEVFNVQFSSDETSVYSMGQDNRFCQWSMNRSGEKITEFQIHERSCDPTAGVRGEYFPSTPRGNLFAFENEDKYVLTCAPSEATVYQVGSGGSLSKTLGITGHSGPVTCVDWLQGRRSFSTCLTGSLDKSIKVTNLLKNDILAL